MIGSLKTVASSYNLCHYTHSLFSKCPLLPVNQRNGGNGSIILNSINATCNNEHLNKTQVKTHLSYLDKMVYSRMTRYLPSTDLSRANCTYTTGADFHWRWTGGKKDFDRQKRSKRRIPQRQERPTWVMKVADELKTISHPLGRPIPVTDFSFNLLGSLELFWREWAGKQTVLILKKFKISSCHNKGSGPCSA